MLPDSVLDGTPEEHYVNTIQAADAYMVRDNVFGYFRRLAICEMLLEKKELEEELKSFPYEGENLAEIEDRTRDFVIESMANIVASHER